MWSTRERSSALPERGHLLLRLCLLCLLWLTAPALPGQNSLPATETLPARAGDTLRLGHDFLAPFSETLSCNGVILPRSSYQIDYQHGWVILSQAPAIPEITVTYRHFTQFFREKYAFRTYTITRDSSGQREIFVAQDPKTAPQDDFFLSSSELKKSGSISRGITVGNNQSLSVQSGLRLQLEGDLGDDLKIAAAITDENIPIQPDGTSQQIQDFDKVFIQVSKRDDQVILGDFEIQHQGTQFANFYRNVQGIGVRIREDKVYANGNAAVAKGKFHTNSFQGQEGNQGPYRLTGRNNERFIIVLAGSEKVFLNGDLLVRGEGNDYTIDYNTGELVFTAQRVISSASRIVVDYEYSDQFYNRSLLFAETGAKVWKDRLTVKLSYGRDADNGNAPISGPYSDLEIDSLRAAGDRAGGAFITGIDSVGPASEQSLVQYARADTVFMGVTYERYVYSTDAAVAHYRISFSFVGTGQGPYVKDQNRVNGTVFRWVGVDSSGKWKGDFAPVRVLPLPRMLQVADLRTELKLSERLGLYSEVAVSSEDKNRFSPLEDGDNAGLANKTGIVADKLRLTDSLQARVELSHRYVAEAYQNIDRVYKVEYGREWNFNDLGQRATENVSEATASLRYGKRLSLSSTTGYRSFGEDMRSFRQLVTLESSHKILSGKYTYTTISTRNDADSTFSRWDRHNGDLWHTVWKLRPGAELWIEDKSLDKNAFSQNGAFRFWDLKPYLKSHGTEKFQYQLYYNYRLEQEFLDSLYRDKSRAHTGYVKLIFNPLSNLNLQSTSSLRNFEVLDSAFYARGLAPNQTLITNFQTNFSFLKRALTTNLLYEATSEQIARKDVAYIEVNAGQGQYEWIDIDSNEVQSLDEFQISTNPLRANFVRVLVPTRELFPTTSLSFSGNQKIELKRLWEPSKNILKETARNFTSITNFRVTQKKAAGQDLSNYLINLTDVFADTSLLEANYTLRQDVYFFRNSPVAELKFSAADNRNKLFLTTGDEQRSLAFLGSEQRVNFGKSKSLENEVRFGQKRANAQNFSTRNYDISFREVKPKVNFQFSRKLRLTTGYEFKYKENANDSGRTDAKITLHKLTWDLRWNIKDRNNLFAKLDLVQIKQTGTASFSAEYELRESLQPGFNAVWQVYLTWFLNKNLELSVNYDGRAALDKPVTHTGRVQLKAYF